MVLRFRNLCILLLVAICLFSAACGGGGDGASSGTHLAVSSSSVTFTSFPYSSLPPSQSIDLSWSGSDVAALGVVYPPDVEPAPWLDLDFYGYASPLTLVFSIKSTSMPAGTYKTTVRVLAGDIDYNLLDAVDIAVTLVLTDTLAISSGSTLSFSMIHGGLLPQAKSVNLIGNEINWTASSSDPWVQLSQQSGTTPSTLSIEADPTGLAPGIHNATVEFMDGAKGDVATLQVQFTIEPNHLAISGSSDLSFNMIYGGLAPQAQAITLDGNGISWTASSSTSWVLLSEQFGNSPSTLSIEVDPTGLTPGVHDATIDFVDHLNNDTVPLHIQLTIEPNHLVVSGSSNLSFNMIYGGLAPQPQSITLDGNGINWTASSSASWILLGEQSGTSPSTLSVEVDPKELTPGVYDATINFVDHLNNDTVTLNVRFTIEPNQLAINGNSNLTFAMVDGGEWPQEEFVSLIGDGAYWTASASDSWVQLSVQSGTAPVTLSLWVDQTGVPPGIHNATVDFVDVYSDRVVTLNVQLSIEPHRLFVNDNGIAMASMPSLSRLSYLVEVSENAGVSTPWTAASDQEWLSVTPGGNTGESLELIADPAGLASNIIHFATVTVSSSDPSIEGPDVIRVGLWVGSSDPNEPASLPLTYTEIAADPIRPLVYMHAGGTDIDIYNVHTGGHVRTIADVGEELGDMEISSDGTFLFVAR